MNHVKFAPELFMQDVKSAIEFYEKAFGARELRRWSNDDGSVHVAEMEIGGALFHMHEEVKRENNLSPQTLKGTSIVLGVFSDDPDGLFKRAVEAGSKAVSPMQDYEYGYRQGSVRDPFGHQWQLQKRISLPQREWV